MTFRLLKTPLALGLALGLGAMSSTAALASAGCDALNDAGTVSPSYDPSRSGYSYSLGTLQFDDGDTIVASLSGTAQARIFLDGNYAAGSLNSVEYTFSGARSAEVLLYAGGNHDITASCTPGGGTPDPDPDPVPEPETPGGNITNNAAQANEYVAPQVSQEVTSLQISSIVNRTHARFSNGFASGGALGGGNDTPALGYAAQIREASDAVLAIDDADSSDVADQKLSAVWADLKYSWVDNTEAGRSFSGKIANLSAGADTLISSDMLVGVSVAVEQSDIDTFFNNGEMSELGGGFAPYFAWNVKDGLIVDATIGYSRLGYDVSVNNDASAGSFSANRVYASVGLTGDAYFGGLNIQPGLRALYVYEKQNGYTDTAGTSIAGSEYDYLTLTTDMKVSYSVIGDGYVFKPYGTLKGEWMAMSPGDVVLSDGTSYSDDTLSAGVALGIDMDFETVSTSLELARDGVFADTATTSIEGKITVPF